MTDPQESTFSLEGTHLPMMRAIVQDRYGSPDVLEVKEIPVPSPAPDEVLVRIRAAGVNPADWHMITGAPYMVRLVNGLGRPKNATPGMDIAGEVIAVGSHVERLKVGDRVFGENGEGYAEYAAAPERRLTEMPKDMDFDQAAATPIAAITALQGLRDKANVKEGDNVLIIGASGGVGTFAVQIAKAFGARVTTVCSTPNLDLVESLGADAMVDYTTTSVADLSDRFDAIIDMAGADSTKSLRRLLTDRGTLVSVGSSTMGNWVGPITHMLRLRLGSMFRSKKMVMVLAKQTAEDMAVLVQLFESGQVIPSIDRRFTLDETPEAIRIQGLKHSRGKSVIVP